jgi:hypothetical protein
MPPDEMNSIIDAELEKLNGREVSEENIFKRIVYGHVRSAALHRETSEADTRVLKSDIRDLKADVHELSSKLAFMESEEIVKLKDRCDKIEKQLIKYAAYATALSALGSYCIPKLVGLLTR